MARMSVDDSALRDPRIARLALMLADEFGDDVNRWPDIARRYALGTLLDVWAVSYDRRNHVIPADDVDLAARIEGFHASMVACGLAEHDVGGIPGGIVDGIPNGIPGGIVVRGARKRVAYLADLGHSSIAAGKKSGEIRGKKVGHSTKHEVDANVLPLVPDSVPDAPNNKPRRKRAVGSAGYQDCVNEFDRLYRDDQGAAPTWNARTGAIMSRLVRAHGKDEVIRRMRILFAAAPAWIDSRDVGTLSSHFDKLATPPRSRPNRDVSVGRYEPSTEPSTDDRAPWEIDEP